AILRALAVAIIFLTFPAPIRSFGIVDSLKILNQHSEHERMTRAALACKPKESSNENYFKPLSMDELTGREEKPTDFFGAISAPDELLDLTNPDSQEGPLTHYDNADFFNGP